MHDGGGLAASWPAYCIVYSSLTWDDDHHGDEVDDQDGVVVLFLEQEGRQSDGHLHRLLAVGVAKLSPVVHRLFSTPTRNKRTITTTTTSGETRFVRTTAAAWTMSTRNVVCLVCYIHTLNLNIR